MAWRCPGHAPALAETAVGSDTGWQVLTSRRHPARPGTNPAHAHHALEISQTRSHTPAKRHRATRPRPPASNRDPARGR